ncbi:hypothetical protein CY34DRAFT_41894, partial [Suillus luteus UH-Slu-Lm8-n1]
DNDLRSIQSFLETLSFPPFIPPSDHTRLRKRAHQFFVQGHRLWRKDPAGRHQLVLFNQDRLRILHETHDQLGHKGLY